MRLIRYLVAFVLLYLPAVAFAALFDVTPTDKSMQYLGQVFGTMGSLPLTASGNPLITQLYYMFNQIVFALAIVIIIVTTVIGTINTAQEGEALGKKMSTVWVPVRAGIGVFLLLPSINGYNWIQLTVMWLIVQGVGAANALWRQTLDSLATEGSVVADTRKSDVQGMMGALTAIYKNTVCMQAVNNEMVANPNSAARMNNDFIVVTPLADGSGIQFARSNPPAGEAPLCGTITAPGIGPNPISGSSDPNDPYVQERRSLYVNALLLAQQSMDPSAAEALANSSSSTWNYSNLWVAAARALRGAVIEASKTPTSQTIVESTHGGFYSQNMEKSKADGWIHAGNYYGQMVATGHYKEVSATFGSVGPNAGALDTILGTTIFTPIKDAYSNLPGSYRNYVDSIETISPKDAVSGSLTPIPVTPPNAGNSNAAAVVSTVFGGSFFQDLAADLGNTITTGCLVDSDDPNSQMGDPIECMAVFGSKIANIAEMTFWIAMGVALLIWLPVSILKGCNPIGWAFDEMLAILMPIATVILMLLWGAGMTLGLYVPMIPLLVFTFSAITWVLLVIEAMLGAPLIALTLIIPSEDEIGKAGHAIVILLGLFLRPALMILGFIFAQKILMVAIGILNFGFKGAMQMSIVGGVGPFGFVAIIVLYTGICTTLVHESFSLIYVLPDKVLRWLGAGGESSEAGHLAKEMEGAHEKGAAIGKGVMKGGLSMAQSVA